MTRTDVIIIGGGQAGLAMSRCLTGYGVDHVVLERGRVAERWRSERWDSLKLLTPNWMTRLPDWRHDGGDPDGFMTMPEVVGFIDRYSRSFGAPVMCGTTVERVARCPRGYAVSTSRGTFEARSVVVATGHCDRASVPAFAQGLAGSIEQITPSAYRNPDMLPAGGVMVVGASATGLQIADEIARAGRQVTLAVGHHIRLPRTHRGRDIMVWLDRAGILDERWDAVADIEAARRQPSLQLVGRDDRSTINLATLGANGVRIVGRAMSAAGSRIHCAGDLARRIARADEKLTRLLGRIDAHIDAAGDRSAGPREPIAPIALDCPRRDIDLRADGIGTVIWATGYRRDYGWLDVPVLDRRGEIRHSGGITPSPGLYVLGLQFLRRRKSSFIDGVGRDAEELAAHLMQSLRGPARLAA